MTNEQLFKGLSILILTAAVATAVCYRRDYLPQLMSAEARDRQMIEAWNRMYETDTYGGSTPEETLQLFVDALKKGDVELASKYFLIEDREENLILLESLSSDELRGAIARFESLKKYSQGEEEAMFVIQKNQKIISIVNLVLLPNAKWKITSA